MTDTLANKRGEGHIKTAVIIISAVVIGGLLIAGIYSLFAGRNGVLKKTEDKLEEMVNTGGTYQIRVESNELQYSYDGETWKATTVNGTAEDAVPKKLVSCQNGNDTVWIIYTLSATNHAWVHTSTDGKTWTPQFYDDVSITLSKSGSKARVICHDGREYTSTNGVDWDMISTKFY